MPLNFLHFWKKDKGVCTPTIISSDSYCWKGEEGPAELLKERPPTTVSSGPHYAITSRHRQEMSRKVGLVERHPGWGCPLPRVGESTESRVWTNFKGTLSSRGFGVGMQHTRYNMAGAEVSGAWGKVRLSCMGLHHGTSLMNVNSKRIQRMSRNTSPNGTLF